MAPSSKIECVIVLLECGASSGYAPVCRKRRAPHFRHLPITHQDSAEGQQISKILDKSSESSLMDRQELCALIRNKAMEYSDVIMTTMIQHLSQTGGASAGPGGAGGSEPTSPSGLQRLREKFQVGEREK